MADDNVVDFGEWKAREERPDYVYPCPECDGQEWLLLKSGWLKCVSCRERWVPPQDFVSSSQALLDNVQDD